MERVVRGQANKVIAMDLGVSQRTVELHRARVMRKLKMRSLAELVHTVGKIVAPAPPQQQPVKDTAARK
jgi:FixJ family two-component response regulator